MKQIRWRDFSLVSKIIIEVGMIAILLFSMNMLFYARINNSMQRMDNVLCQQYRAYRAFTDF